MSGGLRKDLTMNIETIEYAYLSNSAEIEGTWTGDRDAAVAAAVESLSASELADGDYIYHASETAQWYVVDADDMATLGAAKLGGHESEAYSLWCAACGRDATGEEIAEVVSVEIGEVTEEWTSEDDDGETSHDELSAYVSVRVTVDSQAYQVGTMLGLPESEWGTARASGCGVTLGGGPRTWWGDSSDWADLPTGTQHAVSEALACASKRLWREAMALREAE